MPVRPPLSRRAFPTFPQPKGLPVSLYTIRQHAALMHTTPGFTNGPGPRIYIFCLLREDVWCDFLEFARAGCGTTQEGCMLPSSDARSPPGRARATVSWVRRSGGRIR